MKMSEAHKWMVAMKHRIRGYLSDPQRVKRNAVTDSRGRVVHVDMARCDIELGDVRTALLWTRAAFNGPSFNQYVYWDWATSKATDVAMLGLVPMPDIGLTRESHDACESDDAAVNAWNRAFLAGVPSKFAGPDYTSNHVLMHELAHLYHARVIDDATFGREAERDTFDKRRWTYVPEQFPDLMTAVAVSLQDLGADDAATVKAKWPTVDHWVKDVADVHDYNTKKPWPHEFGTPRPSKLRRHQLRRLGEFYSELTSGRLTGRAV